MLHSPASYTHGVKTQGVYIYPRCTTDERHGRSVGHMPTAPDDRKRLIAERVRALRKSKGWSLRELEIATKGRLSKSRLSNYEQGLKLLGPDVAEILAEVFGVPSSYILSLEGDEMVLFDKAEQDLIRSWRVLPERDRAEYARRITGLAAAYRDPVPDERVAKHIPPAPGVVKTSK
jgi:transcriptional regulator with XRE-family HTH domain